MVECAVLEGIELELLLLESVLASIRHPKPTSQGIDMLEAVMHASQPRADAITYLGEELGQPVLFVVIVVASESGKIDLTRHLGLYHSDQMLSSKNVASVCSSSAEEEAEKVY